MKRIQKDNVKQPNRLQAPRRSSLSSLELSKDGSSRRILRKVVRTTELPGGDIAQIASWLLRLHHQCCRCGSIYRERERPAAVLPHEGSQEPTEA